MSAEIVDFFYECGWCGSPVEGDVFFCSDDCEEDYEFDREEDEQYNDEYYEGDGFDFYGEDL